MRFSVTDLGVRGYEEALGLQAAHLERVVAGEDASRLFLVEHHPVVTLGADFHAENLLISHEEFSAKGIAVHKTERGGDVTYHGPGQLVAYPVFNLNEIERDLHKWLRSIEEVIILCLSDLGIEARRFAPHTGVWVGDRKIAAIGVKVRKWVSMHGLAINCDTDLAPFALIVPCGIKGFGVTSVSQELSRRVTVEEVKGPLMNAFVEVFG